MVISGLIINTGAIFFCRRIKNDNNFVTIQMSTQQLCPRVPTKGKKPYSLLC
ncbi:MAG: hypothetical protein KZQ66_15060 [Candidatus Thiodiazotropha sp. (ex Lucinoma aequizonata)]|nr:hypothetical protein [Candidatus Thiodiazotropha sp. (ex Lucinoma aequizonata)]MCU7896104.1 hypothetical protein [Candidatus Thiodiazotropha sp. (ex Lucinoma aequizonata)]MCU7898210.1 hypothetical protein [Candidatus Thiodiazotropha sp. (ex Lucinoma aequizonata)]MCU7903152.1 hypothetical protein [Candidatus Thiodiazotropha sp. (ex Lucinoma aequizonata)]MCU7910477.1 hypothetical protein [Candidatus Thiodiazotropha sp. (ex Lucinoma aequizonata)]